MLQKGYSWRRNNFFPLHYGIVKRQTLQNAGEKFSGNLSVCLERSHNPLRINQRNSSVLAWLTLNSSKRSRLANVVLVNFYCCYSERGHQITKEKEHGWAKRVRNTCYLIFIQYFERHSLFFIMLLETDIREVRHDVYGKRQGAKTPEKLDLIKLLFGLLSRYSGWLLKRARKVKNKRKFSRFCDTQLCTVCI